MADLDQQELNEIAFANIIKEIKYLLCTKTGLHKNNTYLNIELFSILMNNHFPDDISVQEFINCVVNKCMINIHKNIVIPQKFNQLWD